MRIAHHADPDQWRRAAVVALLVASMVVLLPYGAPAVLAQTVQVSAIVETAPVPSSGDAADDSAIWVHPTDPSLSIVIGTDKTITGGLDVYDLGGNELHVYPDGRLNNVDVRYNFPLGGSLVDIVAATNRVNPSIEFYRVVPADRSLVHIGSVPTSPAIVTGRGIALYHSPTSGKFYAFVTDVGNTDQYELNGSSGTITGTLVRQFTRPTATEGLVADDELQRLYIAQEDIGGVYRYGAEPGDGSTNVLVEGTTEVGGALIQDVKGLSIYYGQGGTGYVVAASQGGNQFHLYDRVSNAPAGIFKVVAGNGIDGVTGEDGIDVLGFGLGPTFPDGFFISQDHVNDGFNQNHKLVSWRTIAQAFTPNLLIDNTWDPRLIGAVSGAPETTITAGPNGSVASTSATFQFSASKVGSTFACSLDGSAYTACTSPRTYSGLSAGSHSFQVRATDSGGTSDPTPAVRAWTIDISPPTVSSTVPSNGATAVATSTTVQATFSEAIAPASVTSSTFSLKRTSDGATVSSSISLGAGNATAILTPGAALAPLTGYTATLSQSVADTAGNQLGQAVSWTFTTASAATPTPTPTPTTRHLRRARPSHRRPGRSHELASRASSTSPRPAQSRSRDRPARPPAMCSWLASP